jgi:hypothetical protein
MRDLPDMDKLEGAGLRSKDAPLPEARDAFSDVVGVTSDDGHHDGDDDDAATLDLPGLLNRELKPYPLE